MKLTIRLNLFLFLITGCFQGKKHTILVYKLSSTTDIEVYSMGYGATTKDFTDIKKTESGKSIIVKRISDSYGEGFKAELSRINDTLFKLTFIDTSIFKGMKKSYEFSLKDKFVPFP
jgi:hypothetical protein